MVGSREVSIRSATVEDRDAVLDVVRDAFSGAERDGREELDIVVATWAREAIPLELVAIARGVIVAPLAVAPSRQVGGIASALMAELLHRADAAELPLVVLLGNPAFYGRFGFEPSGPLNIVYRPVGAGNPNFLVRRAATYDPSYQGDFVYCGEQHQTGSKSGLRQGP